MHRWGRLGKPLLAVVLVLGLAAGCGVVRGTITTFQALGRAGYSNPQLHSNGDVIDLTVHRNVDDLDGAARGAAEIVWHNLPLPVQHIFVVCENGFGGRGTYTANRLELEAAFGPRDPDLDRPLQKSELRRIGLIVLGVVAFGFLLLIGIIILIVVLVRRSKNRNQPPPPAYPTGPPPPYHPPA